MRLIDADALEVVLHNFFDGKVIDEPAYILRDVFYHIDSAPTVPLPDFKDGYKQAIIDGKTNFLPRIYKCPKCLYLFNGKYDPDKCPHCDAKMKGGVE